ncbi:Serine/threonine-protein kinase [Wickerhamomyces ciferrii]|uniref:non-specific serine/threonine protein kinase n=1 Tax=Wickerhamomyces ciferrii (strain ATCC 14091 / BCRC 22168 / CBS 111 / JCM 3599 / NBRC 0793 / NRRL Y-1031 F-60-10) TaxID=1206466 RepID=K0KY53_WICCF|nr:Serine/threonine-protein kinase [Wickerhamomyces ciferrii]CCH47007.1 Serine/threonine-protein kinase [Wickerhamomyces ciferrii]
MLKTNQYQVPFLYQNNQNSNSSSSSSSNSQIPKTFHDNTKIHPNLYINTEHHPSLHRADSFNPQIIKHRHSFSSISHNSTIKESINDDQDENESYDEEDEDDEEVDLKNEEDENDYCYGGYHPVEIHEVLNQNYQILRKLGWGHFSTVWLAYDKRHDNHVAIKIVRSQSHYTQAALDEIKILDIINKKNPNHPGYDHLIKLHDWFYHNGPNGKHVCMVFEVLGENMLGLINKFNSESNSNPSSSSSNGELSIKLSNLEKTYGGLPISITKQISKQLLLALDYLHRECGLIHTDIKPENILLEIKNVEEFVKLMKFNKKSNQHENSGSQNPKSKLHSRSSSFQSPIKCSKPLPSPLTSSSSFDFQDYFSQALKKNNQNKQNKSLSKSNSYQNQSNHHHQLSSTSSAGSIKCYDDEHTPDSPVFSNHQNQSTSPATSSNLTSYVVCASEANSDDEDDEETNDENVIESPLNYTYEDQELNSRFSSISIDDSNFLNQDFNLNEHEETNDLSSIINVKLADLGNACFNNLHFTNDIQTRQYRAPEILLGHKWGCSTDIWSCACLIFELITGDYLFDPKNGKNYTKDDDHIAQILELIDDQDVSYQFMYDCKYAPDYFHSDYKTLRRIKNLKYWDLQNVLKQKYKMDPKIAKEIDEFLTPMLKIDPKYRVDAGGWSNHDWLNDVKNCGFINRPCGCCGEDIKGWSTRCRDQ